MPLPIYSLRRLLAGTAILLTLFVAGMYFYARSKATNVLKTIPGKIGFDIKQTAKGFQYSQSDGKRTLFTIEASDLKQFKFNGNAELHNVNIVLYGRDSSRYDQIYGDDFSYNQKTGDVAANGEVQIDLVSNPTGVVSPDQAVPKEVKNPIHLKTRNLVFNKDSGNASTDERVELRTPQASGWAVGVQYFGKTNSLTLESQIHIEIPGPNAATLTATHGVITNDPREIILDGPHLERASGTMTADRATIYLGKDNQVERVLATGNVTTETRGSEASLTASNSHESAKPMVETRGRADEANLLFDSDDNVLSTATLTGNVHVEQGGSQPMEGDAGRVVLDFAGDNELQTVHAFDGAHLMERGSASSQSAQKAAVNGPQDFELTALTIDFKVDQGNILKRAVTSGPAQIVITEAQPTAPGANASGQRTVVTAGKFDANFAVSGGRNHLASVRGAPNARIVNSSPGQPDRTSTSDSVEASFLPQGGIDVLSQKGNFAYTDALSPEKRTQAWAKLARYTPATQMVVLTGDPRVENAGMQTTANAIRIDRSTGDAFADGDVKSTYSDLKEQPNGALLASSSPIHVTSEKMTAHNKPGTGLYTGKARLWQDANIIEAPTIQFDRERRSVTAQGTPAQPVHTILVQQEKPGQREAGTGAVAKSSKAGKSPLGGSSPITITSRKLTYADSDRIVHYEGGVVAKGTDFTASADSADAFLLPRSQTSPSPSAPGTGQLDHLVAQGNVLIQQPGRHAEGQKLVYTAAEEKFVLTGGPPSIFDAERGKITGVSLTFFRRDDRVLVEGEASPSVVTTTRVAQ
ncbi:MAG TPA: LptA/OstA family protein [Candidatus Sulfotelmatobacter sp.]|nr:LptA/OstA family protein [Candidatus Sulfotelmatobacter sp.]